MLTFVTVWTFLLAPHAAATPAPPTVHAVVVATPAPAPIPPVATTTTTTLPPLTPTTVPQPPPEPAQPPATTDLTGLTGGQCAIAWNSDQTNPVNGQSGIVTTTYRGDCGEAAAIADQFPGAVVVSVPYVSDDPGCYSAGDCTSPTMGG